MPVTVPNLLNSIYGNLWYIGSTSVIWHSSTEIQGDNIPAFLPWVSLKGFPHTCFEKFWIGVNKIYVIQLS